MRKLNLNPKKGAFEKPKKSNPENIKKTNPKKPLNSTDIAYQRKKEINSYSDSTLSLIHI